MPKRLPVAILGTGNIGTDLLMKVLRSPLLECRLFSGRSPDSEGLARARDLGVPTSHESIRAIERSPGCCELVFDATSARDHLVHWPILKQLGKQVMDLTPSHVGDMLVPALVAGGLPTSANVNLVSCGGQASIPMAHAISRAAKKVHYVEVVSSIASRSAGPATRRNLDQYIATTEAAICHFTGADAAKAILIVNPANPPIDMQTTISVLADEVNLDRARELVREQHEVVRRYVPGYDIVVPPVIEADRVVTMVKVIGRGDFLPPYAGNLDIINCAAIAAAEAFAAHRSDRLAEFRT